MVFTENNMSISGPHSSNCVVQGQGSAVLPEVRADLRQEMMVRRQQEASVDSGIEQAGEGECLQVLGLCRSPRGGSSRHGEKRCWAREGAGGPAGELSTGEPHGGQPAGSVCGCEDQGGSREHPGEVRVE